MFWNPENYAERAESESKTEKHLENFISLLEAESEYLKAEGIPVDGRCRIDARTFEDVIAPEIIEHDEQRVIDFEKRPEFQKTSPEKHRGELLEQAKTIAFNLASFSKRLVTARTSKYDDYFNGVDQLILDRETNEVIAAIDDTTDPNLKSKAMIQKIQHGSFVKYGLLPQDGDFVKKSLKNLPNVFITMKPEKLDSLAEFLEKKQYDMPEIQAAGFEIIALLEKQVGAFLASPVIKLKPELRAKYEKALLLFQSLNEKEKAPTS